MLKLSDILTYIHTCNHSSHTYNKQFKDTHVFIFYEVLYTYLVAHLTHYPKFCYD